jgi:hypothetical protein
MATTECLAAIHLCRVRATRLNADGTPVAPPNNVVVSDVPIDLAVTPVIEAGKDSTLVGGCDCIIATYRGYDKLKRFDFVLNLGKMDFPLMELMLGSTIITGPGTDTGDYIGQWWTENAFVCGTPAQPNLAFEGWQTGWNQDHQDNVFPNVHWVWPSTYWQIAPHTLQNDFTTLQLTGFSRGNTAWGLGIFGEQPASAPPLGGFFYSATVPSALCGYQSHAIT